MGKIINGYAMPVGMVVFFFMALTGYGQLKGQVERNCDDLKNLTPIVKEVVAVTTDVKNVQEKLDDARDERKALKQEVNTLRKEVNDGLTKILLEIKKVN